MVRSELEVVLRRENYVQVDALVVVDFTRLHSCDHALVVIIVSRFIVGYLKFINNLYYLNSLSNCY